MSGDRCHWPSHSCYFARSDGERLVDREACYDDCYDPRPSQRLGANHQSSLGEAAAARSYLCQADTDAH